MEGYSEGSSLTGSMGVGTVPARYGSSMADGRWQVEGCEVVGGRWQDGRMEGDRIAGAMVEGSPPDGPGNSRRRPALFQEVIRTH